MVVVFSGLVIAIYSMADLVLSIAFLAAIVSSTFLAAGAWAWLRQEERTLGLLSIAAGLAIACGALATAQMQPALVVGIGLAYLPPVLIGHLMLVFPSGSLEGTYQRRLVLLGYVDALVLAVPFVLMFDFQTVCASCEPNPFGTPSSQAALEVVTLLRLLVAAVMTTGLAIALTHSWAAAAPSKRHQLAPVLGAGGMALAAYAVAFIGLAADGSSAQFSLAMVVTTLLSGLIPIALLVGLRRGRFARELAVADLSSKLAARRAGQSELRELLAELLGDPSVEIVYWLHKNNRYVSEQGRLFEETTGASGLIVHPIHDSNLRVGAIVYESVGGDQSELLDSAEYDIAAAMRDSRLEAELRDDVVELSQSRLRLLESADEKRRRIERDLHDGAQQGLISVALELTLTANDPEIDERSRAVLLRSATALSTMTEELRELARGVHPAILTDGGLDGAIKSLAARCPIPTKIRGSSGGSLPRSVESAAYFVVAESLTNIARNSGATSVDIAVTRSATHIEISIRDDGVGAADPSKGSGLNGLADRVAAVGGEFALESPAGEGTRVTVEFPVHAESPAELGDMAALPDPI